MIIIIFLIFFQNEIKYTIKYTNSSQLLKIHIIIKTYIYHSNYTFLYIHNTFKFLLRVCKTSFLKACETFFLKCAKYFYESVIIISPKVSSYNMYMHHEHLIYKLCNVFTITVKITLYITCMYNFTVSLKLHKTSL